MKKYLLLIVSLLILTGCPNEDDLDKNFFNERLTYGEHYFALNPEATSKIGDYVVFQLERNNQEHPFSFDYNKKIGELNENLNLDTIPNYDTHVDRNQNGSIDKEDRGIDRIPVYIYKSSLPDITIKYRFETINNFIFRLVNPETNDVVFELSSANTEYELEIGSNTNFTAGRYVYELESNYEAEDIVNNILRNDFIRGDTIMYVYPVIIQPDRSLIAGEGRQTIDTDLKDELGEDVDRDLFLEDTFILISDFRCIDCDFAPFPNEANVLDRVVNGSQESITLPKPTQSLCLNNFNFRGADFSFADFSNSAFIGAQFGTPNIESNNPRPTNFNNATMVDCNFSNSEFISDTTAESNSSIDIDFTNASFFSSEMIAAKIVGVYGIFVNMEACSFGPGAIFRKNSMRDSDLIGMEARFSDFSFNDFTLSDISKTRFNYSDLSNTSFRRADLVNCDFRGSTCFNTDFCFSYKIGLRLDSIITDETTKCDPTIESSQTF